MFASNTSQVSSGSATYVEDVFSTYLYTGNGYSQTINNGIALGNGQSGTGGSIFFDGGTSRINVPDSSLFTLGNAWCIEAFIYPTTTQNGTIFGRWYSGTNNAAYVYYWDGSYMRGGAFPYYNSAGGPVPLNQWTHVAMTFDGTTKRFFINGSLFASYVQDNSITSTNSLSPSIGNNTSGGAPFPGFISNLRVVSGSAVYTSSFTVPSAPLTAISGTSLLCGQGSSPLTDNSGNGVVLTTTSNVFANTNGPFGATNVIGKGGLVWVKARTNPGGAIGAYHLLTDTDRGASQQLFSNATDAQTSLSALTSFTSSGFALGSYADANYNTATFASWTFAKQAKFFDVVTYTGNGANRTIAHNLGSVPGCIIVKRTDTTGAWQVYHRSLANTEYMVLNTTAAKATGSTRWNSTTPTSTEFSLGTDATVNANGGTYVAYLFAHDAGGFGLTGTDNVISCGSFTTDGSGIATVNLGYEPQWVLLKLSSAAGQDWRVIDTMRGFTASGSDQILNPNLSGAEYNENASVYPTSTGFGSVNAGLTGSQTYIYIAIRRGPMKTPTSGTSVFAPVTRTAPSTTVTSNTNPDLLVALARTGTYAKAWLDKLRGKIGYIASSSTGAEYTGATATLTDWGNTGVKYNSSAGGPANDSGVTYVDYYFTRAPSFFDIVCYEGSGSASSQNLNHNLGVAPELILAKPRNAVARWTVYSATVGNTGLLVLQLTNGASTGNNNWNSTNPTSTVFSVSSDTNSSGNNYVAYLFASCPGVSKVGSYTGTGTTLQIDCGFTGGARFVMIKRTDSTGGWYVWDTARGIIAGNDPFSFLNTTAAETTNTDYIDAYSAGFEISSTAPAAINASGGTFIYLAIS